LAKNIAQYITKRSKNKTAKHSKELRCSNEVLKSSFQ